MCFLRRRRDSEPCFAAKLILTPSNKTAKRANSCEFAKAIENRTGDIQNLYINSRANLCDRIRGTLIRRKKRRGTLLCSSSFFWRRRRDSNPRTAFDGYTISNRARSTNYATSPCIWRRFMRLKYNNTKQLVCQYLFSKNIKKFLKNIRNPQKILKSFEKLFESPKILKSFGKISKFAFCIHFKIQDKLNTAYFDAFLI